MFDVAGCIIEPPEHAEHDRYIAAARSLLDAATFAAAWTASRAMTLEQAIAETLDDEASAN